MPRLDTLRRALTLALVATGVGLTGCVTVHDQVAGTAEVGHDKVVLVGRIEIVPPIRPDEQQLYTGADPFNTKRYYQGRAVLFLATKPVEQERTGDAINPPLEQTFAIAVPRAQRYVVGGGVAMHLNLRTVSARQAQLDRADLLFPVPIELDLRAGDRAIYVGTLRVFRDEFHTVERIEVRDDFTRVAAEHRQKFGADAPLRRALLRLPPG